MPYKGDGKEFSIRIPSDLFERLESIKNANIEYSHLSRNAFLITLLKKQVLQYSNESEKGDSVENSTA